VSRHDWQTIGEVCVGGGENAQEFWCLRCGAHHETVFENGTRGDAGAGYTSPPPTGCISDREMRRRVEVPEGTHGAFYVWTQTCLSSTCAHSSHDAGYGAWYLIADEVPVYADGKMHFRLNGKWLTIETRWDETREANIPYALVPTPAPYAERLWEVPIPRRGSVAYDETVSVECLRYPTQNGYVDVTPFTVRGGSKVKAAAAHEVYCPSCYNYFTVVSCQPLFGEVVEYEKRCTCGGEFDWAGYDPDEFSTTYNRGVSTYWIQAWRHQVYGNDRWYYDSSTKVYRFR
jgi:hypothetical protein